MELKVLSNEEYDVLIRKLDLILELLTEKTKKSRNPLTDIWLDSSEALRLLKISSRTLQNYRDMNTLQFSKIGRKIYYKASDLENLLNNNYSGE